MTDANWRGDGGRELRQILETAAPADIPKLLAFADKISDASVRRDLRNDLVSRSVRILGSVARRQRASAVGKLRNGGEI